VDSEVGKGSTFRVRLPMEETLELAEAMAGGRAA
jgi:signal transduction histidine kinase